MYRRLGLGEVLLVTESLFAMILLIDNYDSFVHNLARYVRLLGQQTKVLRSDRISVEDVQQFRPTAIVISPGPKSPREAGVSLDVVRRFSGAIPILGVCLGHQTIGAAFGADVIAGEPVHGRASSVVHQGQGLFEGLPNPMQVGRYHSLIIDRETLPDCLAITAETADGTIMAVQHQTHLTFGVQFHPESVLSNQGAAVVANFIKLTQSNRNQPASKGLDL